MTSKVGKSKSGGKACDYENWKKCCEYCKMLGGIQLVSDGLYLSGTVCNCRGVCPGCGNTGFVDSHDGNGYTVKRSCIRKFMNDVCMRVRRAQIPSHYRSSNWEWYKSRVGMRQRLAGLGAWVSGGMDGGVWLQGTTGTGKSCMSALITIEAVKKGKDAWWVSMPDLLAKQRRSFEEKMKTNPMERALSVDFLVLDDVDKIKRDGDGKFTPWVDEQIWQLFKERCERGMTTVVTTNTPASVWCGWSRNEKPLASRVKGFFHRYAVSGDDAREQETLAL